MKSVKKKNHDKFEPIFLLIRNNLSTMEQQMRSLLLVALLMVSAVAFCQDSLKLPSNVLADINPGPDSSNPSDLVLIESVGKAYASVTIAGQLFPQIVVTDGTAAGTRLLPEFNITNRGDPYKNDPFWTTGNADIKDMIVVANKLWFYMYHFEAKQYQIWMIDPADDVPRRYEGGYFASINDEMPNLIQAFEFKNQFFVISGGSLCKLNPNFDTCSYYTDASSYKMKVPENVTFDGLTSVSNMLVTEDLMLLTGNLLEYSGLWTFDGSTFTPINFDATTFGNFVYDAANDKYYYSAEYIGRAQLFVYDPSNSMKNYTVLTDLQQNCLGCFTYIGVMSNNKVLFIYNTQIGTTDGTVAGTTLLVAYPRVGFVRGFFEGRAYFTDYTTEAFMSSDGTLGGTKNLTKTLPRSFFIWNGNAYLGLEEGIWKIPSGSTEPKLVRSDISVSGVWTDITLPNGNKQLYPYYSLVISNRGGRQYNVWLYVSDGTGIVQFTGDLDGPLPPPVYLHGRFIIPWQNSDVGSELFYMDPAPESYVTPTTAPGGVSSAQRILPLAMIYFVLIVVF